MSNSRVMRLLNAQIHAAVPLLVTIEEIENMDEGRLDRVLRRLDSSESFISDRTLDEKDSLFSGSSISNIVGKSNIAPGRWSHGGLMV
jgi:hypothetical protein